MDERVFFEQGDVKVTNARFIVGSRTYAMNGVTSVKSSIAPPNRGGLIIAVIVGLLMLAGPVGMKLLGVIVAGVAIWILSQQKSTHAVFLSSASGEVQALANTDEAYIGGVVNALNEALVHRG